MAKINVLAFVQPASAGFFMGKIHARIPYISNRR